MIIVFEVEPEGPSDGREGLPEELLWQSRVGHQLRLEVPRKAVREEAGEEPSGRGPGVEPKE